MHRNISPASPPPPHPGEVLSYPNENLQCPLPLPGHWGHLQGHTNSFATEAVAAVEKASFILKSPRGSSSQPPSLSAAR